MGKLVSIAEGLYVYCIVEYDDSKSFGPIGIGSDRGEVYTIPYRDVSAVVSNTSVKEYAPTEENALAHMNVIKQVMQEYTVLPMRFCTIFRSVESLKKTLTRIYQETKSEFIRLRNKVEVGVKVLWHPEDATKHIRATSKKIQDSQAEIERKTPGIAYLLTINLQKRIEEELNRRAEQYAGEIYRELAKHAILSRESTVVGHMILNGAFLLHRDGLDGFSEATRAVMNKYASQGLEIIMSGPWPPFNFVNIRYD